MQQLSQSRKQSLLVEQSEFEMEAVRCWNASIRLLSRTEKSEAALAKSLVTKGFGPEAIESTIAKLREYGYVDDARFAAAFVRSNSSRLGNAQLLRKLAERGVGAEAAAAAVSSFADADQLELAVRIASRKFESSAGLPRQTQERRVMSLLLRRGFSASIASQALRRLKEGN